MALTESSPDSSGTSVSVETERARMNRTAQLIGAWCGPAMLALILAGLLIGRFLPPWVGPGDDAAEFASTYADNDGQIRAAAVFAIVGFGLICIWGASLAAQTRRKEGVFPVLTYMQLVAMAAGSAVLMAATVFWAVAAFRAGDISPEITQTLVDIGYIMLLSTWLPFTAWNWALAAAILLDRSDTPVFPRWSGYVALWAGLLYVPGNTVWFYKDGAFGWEGAICLYVPIGAFGIWVATFTYLQIQNIMSGLVHEQDLQRAD